MLELKIVRNLTKVSLVMAFVLSYAMAGVAEEPVGQVLLVVGDAARSATQGESLKLKDGGAVFVGDTLQTSKGAALQIKLKDNALLVLQENSVAVIEEYLYDPDQPQNQAAKITLRQGSMRSVTGQLGESNRDAFRLNTPIAAIGIRGTDFETTTTDEITRVRLNSGAVVFSPFNDNCQPQGLGPCSSSFALLLTEDLDSPIAELRATDTTPRLIQLDEYQSSDKQSTNGARQADEEVAVSDQQAEKVVAPGELNPVPTPEPPPLPPDWEDKIHWGRWEAVPLDDVKTVAELMGEGKEPLFGNNVFFLFRDEEVSMLGNDKVDFMLLEAQAVLVGDGAYSPVRVSGGNLSMDFAARSFATGLKVGSSSTGRLDLYANGTIDRNGMFRSEDGKGNMDVLGGLSGDLDQAGYVFYHDLPNSDLSIQGATQWQRP